MSKKPAKIQEKIGYGHPPKAYRFKPGQSGNPSGRPKGIRSLGRVLEEALAQTTTVRVRGRARTMTKLDAAMRTLADGAVRGDPRILRLLLGEIRVAEQKAAAEPQTQEVLTAADQEVIATLMVRVGGRAN
jgi:hypothetical protein